MATLNPRDVVIVDGVRSAMGKSKTVCSVMYVPTVYLLNLYVRSLPVTSLM